MKTRAELAAPTISDFHEVEREVLGMETIPGPKVRRSANSPYTLVKVARDSRPEETLRHPFELSFLAIVTAVPEGKDLLLMFQETGGHQRTSNIAVYHSYTLAAREERLLESYHHIRVTPEAFEPLSDPTVDDSTRHDVGGAGREILRESFSGDIAMTIGDCKNLLERIRSFQ